MNIGTALATTVKLEVDRWLVLVTMSTCSAVSIIPYWCLTISLVCGLPTNDFDGHRTQSHDLTLDQAMLFSISAFAFVYCNAGATTPDDSMANARSSISKSTRSIGHLDHYKAANLANLYRKHPEIPLKLLTSLDGNILSLAKNDAQQIYCKCGHNIRASAIQTIVLGIHTDYKSVWRCSWQYPPLPWLLVAMCDGAKRTQQWLHRHQLHHRAWPSENVPLHTNVV